MAKKSWLLAATVLAPLGAGAPALAQTAAITPQAQPGEKLEEVTVTAEKRRVNAQKTSIQITVLSSEDLQKKGITSLDSLQYAVPGVTVANSGDIHEINIRGIGLGVIGPATSSGIVNYRDGVLITHEPELLDQYYDTDSIQVLEGPQGTLVGSNSTGGAVFYTSRNPDFKGTSGYLQQQVGSYDDLRTEAAVNVPITDELAVRIAGVHESRNSFWSQESVPGVSTNNNYVPAPGALQQSEGRISLLYKPNTDLTLSLKTELNHYSDSGVAGQPDPYSAYYAYAPHVPFKEDYNATGNHDMLAWRSIAQVDWQFAPDVELRSQTSWSQTHNFVTDDVDESAYQGATQSFKVLFSTLQQEFDLISTGNSRLQWSAGMFGYLDTVWNAGPFVLTQYGPPGHPFPFGALLIEPLASSWAQTGAGFGQATYSISPQLQLSVGYRYTFDKRYADNGTYIVPGPFLPSLGTYLRGNSTGKVGLNWQPDSDDLVYVFAAKGAKAGGLNGGVPPADQQFAPERVYDYELGWKSSFLDHSIRTQVDAFYNHYIGFQLNLYDPATATSFVGNASSPATIKGLEGSVQALVGQWGFDAGAAYTSTEFGSQVIYDTRPLTPVAIQLNGKRLPFAPVWTANGAVEYHYQIGQGELVPRFQVNYQGGQWEEPYEVPGEDWIKGRFLMDAHLTYDPAPKWEVEAYVLNLANHAYVQNISGISDANLYGDPRTYGVRATYKF